MSVGENGLHTGGGAGHVGETGRKDGAGRWGGQQAQGGLGDDAEHAFRAGEKSDEVEAGLVLVGASAHAGHGAVGQHDFEAEDVGAGDAVFEAAGAAGVGGDVAADAAVLQAGRIGRIKKPLRAGGGLEASGDDARLDHGDEIVSADLLDAVHAHRGKDDPPLHGHAAADVAVAGAAGGHGDAFAGRDLHHGGDGGGRTPEDNRIRPGAGEPLVAGGGLERGLIHTHRVDAGGAAQLVEEAGVHGALTSP